jgi:hypothetical protein
MKFLTLKSFAYQVFSMFTIGGSINLDYLFVAIFSLGILWMITNSARLQN